MNPGGFDRNDIALSLLPRTTSEYNARGLLCEYPKRSQLDSAVIIVLGKYNLFEENTPECDADVHVY